MTRPIESAASLLLPALVLGAAGDLLFRDSAGLGANVTLWVALVCGAWLLLRRRAGITAGPLERGLLGTALMLGLAWVWRANPMLRLLDACGLIAVAALLPLTAAPAPERAWAVLTPGRLVALLGGLVRRGVAGLVPAVLDVRRLRQEQPAGVVTAMLAVGRGAALAAPPLLLFGALFSSADPAFHGFLASLIRVDLTGLRDHGLGIGIGAWVCAAALGGMLPGLGVSRPDVRRESRGLGGVEVGVSLGLLDLLFALFVVFQLPYLFGGAELVRQWAGVSYAGYARRGFFELVAAAGLTLPLLLAFGARVSVDDRVAVRAYRVLAGVMAALILVIMLSAMHRMTLYQREFGLTQDRFFASALIGGLAVTLLWFAATVLRGRPSRFAPGALVAWAAWLAALHLVDPERVIVDTNLDRAASGLALDVRYLAGLSSDAVPAVVRRLAELPPDQRDIVLARLGEMREPAGWRAWSLSGARARSALPPGR